MAPDSLLCTDIRFREHGRAARRKTVTFFDGVNVIHLRSRRSRSTQSAAPDGLTIDADCAGVPDQDASGEKFRDFRARDKVEFHARDYHGFGDRLVYDQRRDMMLLEGNPAEMQKQEQPGRPPTITSAKSMRYFRRTGEIQSREAGAISEFRWDQAAPAATRRTPERSR